MWYYFDFFSSLILLSQGTKGYIALVLSYENTILRFKDQEKVLLTIHENKGKYRGIYDILKRRRNVTGRLARSMTFIFSFLVCTENW